MFAQCLFNNRVATGNNIKSQTVIHGWAYITLFLGQFRERRGNVQLGNPGSNRLQGVGLIQYHLHDIGKMAQFKLQSLSGGISNLGFKLGQFGGGKPHGVGHGLAVDEPFLVVAQCISVQRRHLDEISQHVVVADLKILHPGLVSVAGLKTGNDLLAFIAQLTLFIQFLIKARSNKISVAGQQWHFISEQLIQVICQRPG